MGQSVGLSGATLKIFNHHLYELSRGIRPLVLMTLAAADAAPVIARLAGRGIAYHVHEACPERINVVFGSSPAVSAVQRFLVGPLCDLSAEHDFMLGVLLGYDREMQCVRYLARADATPAAVDASLPPTSAPHDEWSPAASKIAC